MCVGAFRGTLLLFPFVAFSTSDLHDRFAPRVFRRQRAAASGGNALFRQGASCFHIGVNSEYAWRNEDVALRFQALLWAAVLDLDRHGRDVRGDGNVERGVRSAGDAVVRVDVRDGGTDVGGCGHCGYRGIRDAGAGTLDPYYFAESSRMVSSHLPRVAGIRAHLLFWRPT